MKPTRSTALAERILVWAAIIVFTWFFGYEYGMYKVKSDLRECVAPRQMKLDTKKAEKRFINYYRERV